MENKRAIHLFKDLMVIGLLISVPILLLPILSPAQTTDSTVLRANQEHILELEEKIKAAQQSGDLSLEFDLRAHHILDVIRLNYDNNRAYELALELEVFVNQHPHLKQERPEARRTQIMAMLYRDMYRTEEALIYLENGTKVARAHNWISVYIEHQAMYLELLSVLDRDSLVMSHFRQSMKGAEILDWKRENKEGLKYRLQEYYGEHWFRNQQYDSAIHYLKISLQEPKDDVDRRNYNEFSAGRHKKLAKTFLAMDEVDSAIHHGMASLKMANEGALQREEFQAYELLQRIYEAAGDTANAYKYLRKFHELKEQVQSYQDALQMSRLSINKEKEQATLQQMLAEEQLANQRLVIWLVSGGLLLLIVALLYIFNRLNYIRKQNKIIAQEKLRAEHSEKVKEQFLANMSHEIRTPMNAISGMINSMQRRNPTEEQKVYLESMKLSASNLLVILNDILDMSKLAYGKLDITKVPMNLVEVCNQVVYLLKQKAHEKGVDLIFEAPKDFPPLIIGDPVRMNQILVNLVGNAIKFTDEGQITINVSCTEDTYTVQVRDTGIGIPKETLPHIFEQFKQGEGPLDKRYAGTGLGLSISRQLVALQNGKIWVESEPGEGSVFSFELPLIRSDQPVNNAGEISEQELRKMGIGLGEISILIAEDNPLNKMVIEDDLKWFAPQAKLTFVENGAQALEKWKQNEIDLILMDVQMPEMNGYVTTREIRKMESTRRTPIIAMTASLLKDQIEKCYEMGMDQYIPKPYTSQQLIETICQTMEAR